MFSTIFQLGLFVSGALAATCYYPDGSEAKGLNPCGMTDLGYTSCCPSADADIHPFNFPFCVLNGLCRSSLKVGEHFGRGGCTDPTFQDPSCPRYCLNADKSSAAPITDNGPTGASCCQADYDAGLCSYSPPSGTAFLIAGNTPIYWAENPEAFFTANFSESSTTVSSTSETTTTKPSSTPTTITTHGSVSLPSTSTVPLPAATTNTPAVGGGPFVTAGNSTTTSRPSIAVASKAGAWSVGVQREMGYLAGGVAGILLWLA